MVIVIVYRIRTAIIQHLLGAIWSFEWWWWTHIPAGIYAVKYMHVSKEPP